LPGSVFAFRRGLFATAKTISRAQNAHLPQHQSSLWGVPSEGEAMTIEIRGGHHSLLRFDTMNDLSQTG
jgi:hypothetical protein